MADQEGGKKGVIDMTQIATFRSSYTRGIVINSTGKPTTPAPQFTSSSGAQVNPAAPKQNTSGQAGGNTPEKK